MIHEGKDDTYYVSLHKMTSKHYVVIHLASITTSEIRLLDTEMADIEPSVFLPRRKDHEYSLDYYQHWFYPRSSRHGKNFGLYRTRMCDEQQWEELVPPYDNIVLEGSTLFIDWLVAEEHQRGLINLRQTNRKAREVIGIAFDGPAYVAWTAHNPEPKTARLRYGCLSTTTLDTLSGSDMDTGERHVLKQTGVPGPGMANYRSEHLWIVARDGVKIPVSLAYHCKHFREEHNLLLVYGYGSYGVSINTDLSFSRLGLLDRGFVYAIIHVRGGGELGQQWYEGNKFLKKKNTFNDYLGACDALLKLGYGSLLLYYAMGGNAGGILIGATIDQRPELFHGVITQVPFVDVITTMLDESIPPITDELEEWGNPQDPQYYEYVKSYSSYDNVTAQVYPHLLVTTGLYDSQVQYWEPAEWVTKLRELKTDDHLLSLYTGMDPDHGGKSGRSKSYEDVAMEYAFLVAPAQGTLPAQLADQVFSR